jgi:hypothetical protein
MAASDFKPTALLSLRDRHTQVYRGFETRAEDLAWAIRLF